MKLNKIKPKKGSLQKVKRLGRGMGSGKGKTCGKGHKGQKARSGYNKKLHFEGGQMPKQRRLPKTGFVSLKNKNRKVLRSFELNDSCEGVLDLKKLRSLKMFNKKYEKVKIILKGDVNQKIKIKDINMTDGVKSKLRKNIEEKQGE